MATQQVCNILGKTACICKPRTNHKDTRHPDSPSGSQNYQIKD